MAVTLTPNLKLRVDSSLTADAQFNLNRIDTLGGNVLVDSTSGNLSVRSGADIFLFPEVSALGGGGSGGTVSVGISGVPVTTFDIHATNIDFNGATILDLTVDAAQVGDGSVNNTEFSYLDGVTSNIQAQIDSLSGVNQTVEMWLPADGTTKTITHNFGTRNIIAQVLDMDDNYANVEVETIQRPNDNQVVLSSSEAPATEWLVLLVQVGI